MSAKVTILPEQSSNAASMGSVRSRAAE